MLTEDKIKLASLRFLKNHYKFRPRVGPTTAHFDMKSEEGIIADGHLFFVTQEGEQFLATFEATSDQIFEEVKYKPEHRILFWDSLAAGFVVAALTFIYGFVRQYFTVREVGWPMTLSIVFLSGLIGFWGYRYLVRNRHRFRYIYAIEQFKRYHADEQWIAIADTIFRKQELSLTQKDSDPIQEDDFFEELKRQCVDFGIGLLLVSKEETVQLLISPARQDVFDNKRKMIHFVTQNIRKGQSWGRRLSDKGRNALDKVFGRSKNSTSLQRFRRSFYKQIMICAASVVLMSFIFYREFQDLPISYINKKDFEKEMQQRMATGDMETLEFIVDSNHLVRDGQFSEAYLQVSTNQTASSERTGDGIAVWKINENSAAGGSVYLQSETDTYSTYDCERLFNFEEELFLIKYKMLPNFKTAKKELGRLTNKKMNANILWLGCFENQEFDYAIYFDLLHVNRYEAEKSLMLFQKRLEKAGFEESKLSLIKIIH